MTEQTPMAQPSVALIFPPLIESNFGSLYPSTPVLSAFLRDHGFGSVQFDLNEEFADYLFTDLSLAQIGSGKMPLISADSVAAASARWTRRNRGLLLDDTDRHLFGDIRNGKTDLRYQQVPEFLARPFSIDPESGVLTGWYTHPAMPVYEEFYDWSDIAARVPSSCRLIGISVPMGPQLAPALLLARHLKSKLSVKVVLGGATLSLMNEEHVSLLLDNHPDVDFVVRYDGEHGLLALVQHESGELGSLAHIGNVSYRSHCGVTHNPAAPGPHVDRLPTPHYAPELLARLEYPVLGVTQARGCYWGRCEYCDFVEVYEGSPRYRGRRAESLVAEMAELYRDTGISAFRLITDSLPPTFAGRFSEALRETGLPLSWSSFAMVEQRFTAELFGRMKDAGCDHLIVGLETMVDRVLAHMSKAATSAENIRFLRDAHRVGLRLVVNLIPDLPTTTYTEAMHGLARIEEVADCLDGLTIFPFEATASSALGRAPEAFGLITTGVAQQPAQAQFAMNQLRIVDPAMSVIERAEVHRRYYAFAKDVNAANVVQPAPRGMPFQVRVPLEWVDLYHRTPNETIVTNFEQGTRTELSGEPATMLQALGSGSAPLRTCDPSDELRRCVNELIVAGALVHDEKSFEPVV